MLVIDKAPGSRRGLFALTRVNKPVAISAALELGECLIFSAAFVGIAQALALHRAMVACICFGASCGVIWQAHHFPPILVFFQCAASAWAWAADLAASMVGRMVIMSGEWARGLGMGE